MRITKKKNSREVALSCLLKWKKEGSFAEHLLDKEGSFLHEKDRALAFELLTGVQRRYFTLEAYLNVLTHGKPPKKEKEKLVLFMALYQRLFHTKLPEYAFVYEYVQLAKEISLPFSRFVNAILHKSLKIPFSPPTAFSSQSLSIRESYPPFFIELLMKHYKEETVRSILEAENCLLPLFARGPFENGGFLIELASQAPPSWYIQNPTQPLILQILSKDTKRPSRVLDLCAGVGGKLFLVSDMFHPEELVANEPSYFRHQILQENLAKRAISAQVLNFPAQQLIGKLEEKSFNLILVDAPCTGSGTLYKNPEARMRLTEENLKKHISLQKELLKIAKQFMKDDGAIWYTTCSILPEENEDVVLWAEKELGLTLKKKVLIFPDTTRYEGGFGALLS